MNCLIVDDQKIFRMLIKRFLSLDSSLVLIGESEDAFDALQKIKDHRIDLIFLDVQMPGMSGLELAKILEGKSPLVIFTTSLAEYAVDAFDLNVIDFLLKPITPARFIKAVEKAKEVFQKNQLAGIGQTNEFAFIRESNVVRRLKVPDILYLEATADYVNIRMENGHFLIHSSLKNIQQKLPPHLFLRVHRSFIVNVSKVDSSEGKTLIIKNYYVPVSDAYRSALNKVMLFL